MQREFILNFHGLGSPQRPTEPGEDDFWVPVGAFETYLDLVCRVNASGRCRVSITFDDGNLSDVEVALPRLLDRNLRARFFLVAGRIGEPHFLSDRHVRMLKDAGMGVGTHGFHHLNWQAASNEALAADVRDGADRIAAIVNAPVDEAAIPYGFYDRRVLRCLKDHGFRAAYTSDEGSCRPGAWLKPRTCIRRDMRVVGVEAVLLKSTSLFSSVVQELRLSKRRFLAARLA